VGREVGVGGDRGQAAATVPGQGRFWDGFSDESAEWATKFTEVGVRPCLPVHGDEVESMAETSGSHI